MNGQRRFLVGGAVFLLLGAGLVVWLAVSRRPHVVAISGLDPASLTSLTAEAVPGHITALGHEPHQFTHFYVQVDDIPATLAKVDSLGGKTIVPPVTIPNGTFAWFADPEGNTIGLWTPAR